MLERNIINSLGMKKKTKRFIGFLGAACLVFSLAACKNDKITSEANAATLESRIIESTEYEASMADKQLPSELQKTDIEPQNGKSDILVAYFSATG
ncbi:MAG: hypothetical protein ACLUI7_12270, partial [Coprococcus sp.]